MRLSTCTPFLSLQHLHGRALSPTALQFNPWEQGTEIKNTLSIGFLRLKEIFSVIRIDCIVFSQNDVKYDQKKSSEIGSLIKCMLNVWFPF